MQINTRAWVIVAKFEDGGLGIFGPFDNQNAAESARQDVVSRLCNAHPPRNIDAIQTQPLLPV